MIVVRALYGLKSSGAAFRALLAETLLGGHTTEAPSAKTYPSVVSSNSVRIALTISALNNLDILACDIHNAYLTAQCRRRFGHAQAPSSDPKVDAS